MFIIIIIISRERSVPYPYSEIINESYEPMIILIERSTVDVIIIITTRDIVKLYFVRVRVVPIRRLLLIAHEINENNYYARFSSLFSGRKLIITITESRDWIVSEEKNCFRYRKTR